MDARSRHFRMQRPSPEGGAAPGVCGPPRPTCLPGRPARAVTRRGRPASPTADFPIPPAVGSPLVPATGGPSNSPPIVRLRFARREAVVMSRIAPELPLLLLDARDQRADHAYHPRPWSPGSRPELDSGERVISERLPHVRSATVGYWIATGSRDETDARPASRTSSSTCSSRGRAATGRSRSPRSSTRWAAS